jgi:hypothetical protein
MKRHCGEKCGTDNVIKVIMLETNILTFTAEAVVLTWWPYFLIV